MVKKIKVNTDRLNNDAVQINECIHSMKNKSSSLEANVGQLNKMWKGDANKAFNEAFHEDIKALNEFIRELDKLHEKEVYAKTKYEKCESQVSDIISRIKV